MEPRWVPSQSGRPTCGSLTSTNENGYRANARRGDYPYVRIYAVFFLFFSFSLSKRKKKRVCVWLFVNLSLSVRLCRSGDGGVDICETIESNNGEKVRRLTKEAVAERPIGVQPTPPLSSSRLALNVVAWKKKTYSVEPRCGFQHLSKPVSGPSRELTPVPRVRCLPGFREDAAGTCSGGHGSVSLGFSVFSKRGKTR